MVTDAELVREAVDAGRVRHVPKGVRALSTRPDAEVPKSRPEGCGSGRWVGSCPALDQIDGDEA